MRLMAEPGMERPLDRYVRLKNNIQEWYNEMDMWGLSNEQQKMLEQHYLQDYGTPPYQESVMTILMEPELSNFSLTDANAARKIIGKKQMNKIPELEKKFFNSYKQARKEENNYIDDRLPEYVWETAILPQMGYSLNEGDRG